MKTILIGAGSDLGVHIDGAHLAPTQLLNDLNNFYQGEKLSFVQADDIIKSRNLSDRRKNEYEIDKFNSNLYENVLEKLKDDYFPITIGGDNSISIATALASMKVNENIGIIWIDSHTDFNTFTSTQTGNIAGMSLAAICGYKCEELRYYHDGNTVQPSKVIIVGARSIDELEKDNLRYAGVTYFSTEDIKKEGVEVIMSKAFAIAGLHTKKIHICYDIGIINPEIAPGVSIPEYEGITDEDAIKINEEILKNLDKLSSYDLVEFNPLRDRERKTEQIAVNILAQTIQAVQNYKRIISAVENPNAETKLN